ncbi:MAG: hypothetical protein MJ078_07350, partial [Clostridia bacterium]|nr:hypothetical protein [Clostridia bacterium]
MNDTPALPKNGKYSSASTEKVDFSVEKLPDFKVSGCFSSNMVLQREKPINVWGFSNKIGMVVSGTFDGENCMCKVDESGCFELEFAPRPATKKPLEMEIRCPEGSVKFTDILIGDVWFIGGQSNGEHSFGGCVSKTPELADFFNEDKPLRLFRQTQAFAANCKEHF